MDTRGFSDIGRYGTIYLMKALQPNTPIAAYPLDDEEITFGRDQSCSVRLYYPQVSAMHCKIMFEDRKAFLVVLGTNGVVVDGCQVFPSQNPSTGLTTIPLPNNSEIEIHNKRFLFTYPPKELRAALLAAASRTAQTPHRRRALRMSMIQSAQVFSPRPSPDPRENLRILQSPLRPFSSSRGQHAPGEADEEIVLVDGNHPRVVEEEKDLIILEDVEVGNVPTTLRSLPQGAQAVFRTPGRQGAPGNATPPHAPQHGLLPIPPQPIQLPPQTPQRRIARPSLHRAVLIRSAQRAVLKAEMEREEEEEEKEVEEFATQLVQSTSEESSSGSDGEASDEDEAHGSYSALKTLASPDKSLISPRSAFPVTGNGHPARSVGDFQTPRQDRKLYGDFMTPQPKQPSHMKEIGTYSVAGKLEARRVPIEQPWRVRDIILPELDIGIKKESASDVKGPDLEPQGTGRGRGMERLTEEQRKAIQERRRSALRTPDPFFGGQAPGIRRPSEAPSSPTKPTSPQKPTILEKVEDEEDELDTRSMLDKMKETVEGMKRRRSMLPPSPVKPDMRKSLGLGLSPTKGPSGTSAVQERRFSLLAPAARDELFGLAEVDEDAEADMEESEMNKEFEMEDDEKENECNHVNAKECDVDMNTTETAKPVLDDAEGPAMNETYTPRMDGLRYMFAEPKAMPSTPSFKGLRDLFKIQRPQLDTPIYDGVGELIQTPEGYHLAIRDDANEEEPRVPEPQHKAPVKKAGVLPTRISKRSGRTGVSKDTPSLADDEATPGDTKDSTSQVDSDFEEKKVDLVKSKTKSSGTKLAGQVPPAPTKALRARRVEIKDSNETTAEKSTTDNQSEGKPKLTRTIVQRKRKPASPTPITDDTSSPTEGSTAETAITTKPPSRRGYKIEEAPEPPAQAESSGKASRARKGRSITAKSAEADADELQIVEPKVEEALQGKRRTAKSRTVAASAIKEEVHDVPLDGQTSTVAAAKRTRSKDKTTASSSTKSTAANSTSRTRTVSRRGTTTTSSVTSDEGMDKENARGATSPEGEDVSEKTAKPVRATRSKKNTAKEDPGAEEMPTTRRVTRARLRT